MLLIMAKKGKYKISVIYILQKHTIHLLIYSIFS